MFGPTVITGFHPTIFNSLCIACLLVPVSLRAQADGRLAGRVMDRETGEPVTAAQIRLEGTSLGTFAEGEGRFFLLGVPPGTYTVVITAFGYREYRIEGLEIRSGLPSRVGEIQLVPEPLQAEATVVQAKRYPLIGTDEVATRHVITSEELQGLPIEDVGEALELQPGVVGGHIRGGRLGQEVFFIDGIPVKNFFEGSTEDLGLSLSTLAVEEIDLLTGGFTAEFGQALSGAVNLVTKEGGDRPEGTIRAVTDELTPAAIGRTFGYNRVQATLGGPLPGPATFFLAGEATGRLDARPAFDGLTFPSERDNLPHNEGDEYRLLAKITAPFSNQARLGLLFLRSRDQRRFYNTQYKYNLDNYLARRRTGTLLAANFNHALASGTPTILQRFQLSAFRTDAFLGVLEPGWFEDRTEIGNFGFSDFEFLGEEFAELDPEEQARRRNVVPGFTLPRATGENPHGVADPDLFIEAGQFPAMARSRFEYLGAKYDLQGQLHPALHSRVGVEGRFQHVETWQRRNPALPAVRPNFIESYPFQGAAYMQHSLHVEDFTASLGVRVDFFDPRIDFPVDPSTPTLGLLSAPRRATVSPRFGFAVPITSTLVARVNFGLFRQTPDIQFLFNTAFEDTARLGARRVGNPELDFEEATQWELSVSKLLLDEWVVTATGFMKDLTGLVASQVRFLGRPSTAQFFNADFGTVEGLELVAERRFDGVWGLKFGYGLQGAEGTVSEGFALQERFAFDPRFPDSLRSKPLEEFPLDFDQRHTFDLQVRGEVPRGIGPTVGRFRPLAGWGGYLTTEVGSGFPFTRTDVDGVPLEPPNDSRLPWTWVTDLRVYRDIPVGPLNYRLFAEVRNLFDRRNVRTVRADTGEPEFSAERAEALAADRTADAQPIPRESPSYIRQQDLDGDGLITVQEQLAAVEAAILDGREANLFFGEPRHIRLGLTVVF